MTKALAEWGHYGAYDDAFTLWLDRVGAWEETGGDVESPVGWYARAGRNLVRVDETGEFERWRCWNVADAKREFAELVEADSDAQAVAEIDAAMRRP